MSCNCCDEATVTPCTGVTEANVGELTLVKGKRSNACDAWQEVPAFVCQSLNQTLAKKLADGEVPVPATATDVVITADCKLVNLNGAAAPETPLTVTPTNSVNLIAGPTGNGHTGLSADVNISAAVGNGLVINADGLFAPAAVVVFDDQVLTVNNTPSVSLTATPSAPIGTDNQINYTLSADVKVSATAGNQIVTNADGIFVAAATAETPLTVTDSSTIDLTAGATGNGHTGLTASVKLSATAGNLIVANADGLFAAETPLTVTDSATVDLTAGATGNGHTGLTASVKLSAAANNQIVANADGLFVDQGAGFSFRVTTGATAVPPAGGVTIGQGDALHFWSATGVNFTVVAGSAVVGVDISLSTDAGNQIAFGTDGKLYVAAATGYTDEEAQDAVAAMTTTWTTYTDATPSLVPDSTKVGVWIPTTVLVNPDYLVGTDASGAALQYPLKGTVRTGMCLVASDPAYAVASPTTFFTSEPAGCGHSTLAQVVAALISGDAGNTISIGTDNKLKGSGAAETALTTTNTATLNLTPGGTGNGHTGLSGSVNISADPDNALVSVADGLYVATPADPDNCVVGAYVAAATPTALPVEMVVLDGTDCLNTVVLAPNQVIYADEAGANKVNQDADFRWTSSRSALVASAGSAENQTNAAVVGGNGNNIYGGTDCSIIGSRASSVGAGDTNSVHGAIASSITSTGFGNIIVGGVSNTIAGGDSSLVTGNTNVILVGTGGRLVLGGFNNSTLAGDNSDTICVGGNNRLSNAFNSAVFGNNNRLNDGRTLVSGRDNVVTTVDSLVAGAENTVNGIGVCVVGSELTVDAGFTAAAVFGDSCLPVVNAIGRELFVLGNGDNITNTKRNAFDIRLTAVHQWPIAVQAGTNLEFPQFANAAAAVAALNADMAGYGVALRFGALAMVDVAGTPMWFKYDGTTWMFAF